MKGSKHSLKSKRKMSEARKGGIGPFKGKHHTEETRKKLRESHKGQISWRRGLSIKKGKRTPRKMINGKRFQISHLVWLKENQLYRIPDGCVIHHINGDVENNNIENLQLMDKYSHDTLHREISKALRNC